jgi:hypothetical protein
LEIVATSAPDPTLQAAELRSPELMTSMRGKGDIQPFGCGVGAFTVNLNWNAPNDYDSRLCFGNVDFQVGSSEGKPGQPV